MMQISRRKFAALVGGGIATGIALPSSLHASVPTESAGSETKFARLDHNENPYGPSPRALQAIRDRETSVNHYPGASREDLAAQIASHHNVKPEQVILGCGSTEVLRMSAQALLGKNGKLVQASATYEAIEKYSRAMGCNVTSIPLNSAFAHDLDAMLRSIDGSPTLVYICNPNNPTGSITPRNEIDAFLGHLPRNAWVLIDEAYHHYANESTRYSSFLDHPVDHSRVMVTRTFSAVYGLAGVRLGYGIAPAPLAAQIRSFATEENVNTLAAAAGMAALADQEFVDQSVKRNADDRQDFVNQCHARMLKPIDSQANFMMLNTFHPAAEVIEHFHKHQVAIGRLFPALDSYIRVSLGKPEDMQSFWDAWDLLPFAKSFMHH